MREMDISEYSYKNGYEKGKADMKEELTDDLIAWVSSKIVEYKDRRDDFTYGERKAYREVLNRLGDIIKETEYKPKKRKKAEEDDAETV